jgi:plastocyanin
MNSTMRVALGIGIVAVAVVLFAVLKDDGDDNSSDATTTTATQPAETTSGAQTDETSKPAEPVVPTIVVDESGKPVGGVAEISVDAGEEIRFEVKSAVDEEVHVHGYDVEKAVPAAGTATLAFPADIEGLFEVELHHSGEQIAELRVNP